MFSSQAYNRIISPIRRTRARLTLIVLGFLCLLGFPSFYTLAVGLFMP